MKRKVLILLFLFLASLPLIYPFLQPGYFPTHDGEWAVVRLAEMHRELRSLQIPPRWAGYLNHGYGYPLFQFSYPGPYFLAEIFYLVGFGLTDAIKIVFSLTVILSGLFMFLLGQKLWGTAGALVSTTLYLYAPYRISNLFVRGSIGESLVFVLMPLLFWLFLLLAQKPTRQLIFFTSLSMAILMISHNVLVLLFLPVLLVWSLIVCWHEKDAKVVGSFIYSWIIGLGVSSWFWLPALIEKQYIRLSFIPLANRFANFVTFKELLSLGWSFGIRPPLQIGLIHFIIGFISFIIVIYKFRKSEKNAYINIIALMLLVSFSLLFSNSHYFWKLPLFGQVDFPWRILGIILFLMSLLGGNIAGGKYKIPISVLGILLIMIFQFPYIQTRPRIYKSDDYYTTNDATTTSANELMPIWVGNDPQERPKNAAWITGTGKISILQNTDTEFSAKTDSDTQELLKVNKVYFPGWTTYIDGKKIVQQPGYNGLIDILVPAGEHQIDLRYQRTSIRTAADIISILLLLFAIYHYIVAGKNFAIK